MAKNDNKDLTPEELAAKEADEKAKADALAKEVIETDDTANGNKPTSPEVENTEPEKPTPPEDSPKTKVYGHLVKHKGKFYNAGEKIPLE